MDTNKAASLILAIITTMEETSRDNHEATAIEGYLYAALMSQVNLDEFNTLIGICVRGGLISRLAGHELQLTERGRKVASEYNTALAAKNSTPTT